MAAVWRFFRGLSHRFLALRVWPLPRSMATFGIACCFRFRPGVFPRVASGDLVLTWGLYRLTWSLPGSCEPPDPAPQTPQLRHR